MAFALPLWLQYAVIGMVVAIALWIFAKKQLPGTLRRARVALAAPLVRDGRPAWMRSLARRIAPPGAGPGGAACGGCDNCGPEPKQR